MTSRTTRTESPAAAHEGGTAESAWPQRLRQPGWVLLPQRLFLGVTFTYAGLQKLADPHYFAEGDPQSVAAQMERFRHSSPIGPLVGIAAEHSYAFGLLIALAEIGVGLATLVGLWSRAAAVGGALLSLTFLLTVSWRTTPYYYGSDIGFLVMWLPIIGYGAAGVLSLDALLARRRAPGEPLLGRRSLLQYAASAGVLAMLGLGGAWMATAVRGRLVARMAVGGVRATPTPSGSASPPSTTPTADALVAGANVPVGGAVLVNDASGPIQVLQPTAGTFVAFSAVCTHAGCTVAWTGAGFNCPCHGAIFDAAGRVVGGPAPSPLSPVAVRVDGPSIVRG
ncbi:MAG: Rieske 2Fe-2S domain-containing protein [Actinomycetota bacterium]|nr:Rieske 2Fe-2S domain-containing protein [Actinomycetota bacterium]